MPRLITVLHMVGPPLLLHTVEQPPSLLPLPPHGEVSSKKKVTARPRVLLQYRGKKPISAVLWAACKTYDEWNKRIRVVTTRLTRC